MKTNRKIFLIVITIFCLTTLGGYSIASDIKKPDTITPEIKGKPPSLDRKPDIRELEQRPDLIVSRIEIVSDQASGEAYVHNITIHVKNQGRSRTSASVSPEGIRNNSRGDFKVRMAEVRPDGSEATVCEFTMHALDAGDEDRRWCCFQLIPRGESKRYRAKVDSSNWIIESRVDNNEKFVSIMGR